MSSNTKTKGHALLDLIVGLQIISPLLIYYNIPFTTIGINTTINLLSLVFGLYYVIADRNLKIRKKSFENSFAMFSVYLACLTVGLFLFAKYKVELGMTFINMLFVAVVLLIYPKRIRYSSCIKLYKVISYVSIGFFLLQFFADIASGRHLDLHIPFLPLQESSVSAFRTTSAGFFSEPAHLAQFITPLIVISLFGEDGSKNNLVPAIFLTVVCLMTISGNAIVICALLWAIFFGKKAKDGKAKGLIWYIIGIAAFFIVIAIVSRIPEFMRVVNRLFYDRTGEAYNFTKADYRIYRGFDYYLMLPWVNKIFGVGYKALESFAKFAGISSQYDTKQSAEYLNAVAQTLVYSGAVGFILYAKSLVRMAKDSNLVGKMILLTYFALSISSSILLDSTMIFFIFIAATQKNTSNDKGGKEVVSDL